MPKLPKNMVRRKGRSGYYFREKRRGKVTWIALGSDYQEARRLLRSLKSEERRPSRQFTVEQAATQWLDSYIATSREPRSQGIARRRVETYLVPYLGHQLLFRLKGDDLRGYRLYLEKLGKLSPQTVRHILADARCFLRWCEDTQLLERSPFPRRLLPKIQERPPDRLGDAEVERLVAMEEPYGFICRLGLGTGLRWGELAKVTSHDVQDGCLVIHHTKSGRLRRIPLTQALLAEVKGRVGRLIHYSPTCQGAFARRVRKLSKIPGFHAHQMRHTFACSWLERGGSLAALQELMGHVTIVTTQRYARLSHDLVKREAQRLEREGVAKGVAKAV